MPTSSNSDQAVRGGGGAPTQETAVGELSENGAGIAAAAVAADLQSLPPDAWAECLHHLSPDELSRSSLLLSKSLSSEERAERAAYLALLSMANVANCWMEEYRSATQEQQGEQSEYVRVGILVSQHPLFVRIVGEGAKNEAAAAGNAVNANAIFRFRDEKWQQLYGLLHGVISRANTLLYDSDHESDPDPDSDSDSESNEDHADRVIEESAAAPDQNETLDAAAAQIEHQARARIALAVWLLFGAPTMPPLPNQFRKLLASVGKSFSSCLSTIKGRFTARAVQIALRLGKAGSWDVASDILSLNNFSSNLILEGSNVDDDGSSSGAPVTTTATATATATTTTTTTTTTTQPSSADVSTTDIDCMIYATTFLVDRLYSETYVRQNNERDTRDLVNAVRIGRKAVEEAKTRYNAFLKKVEAAGGGASNILGRDDDDEEHDLEDPNQPQRPATSFFVNDAIRCMNARLALAKALALLAQHIGIGATDLRSVGILPASYNEEEQRFAASVVPSDAQYFMENLRAIHYFFDESKGLYDDIADSFVQHGELVSEMEDLDFVSRENAPSSLRLQQELLTVAAEHPAAFGEMWYCATCVNSRFSAPVYASPGQDARSCISYAVQALRKAFKLLLSHAKGIALDDANLAIRIAKDLGKVYHFAEAAGLTNEFEGASEPGVYLDFAYLVSCHQNGPDHPTSRNINRLDVRSSSEIGSVTDRYNRLVPWLTEKQKNERA